MKNINQKRIILKWRGGGDSDRKPIIIFHITGEYLERKMVLNI